MVHCICVLCMGSDCSCSVQDQNTPRLSCTGCRPAINAKPLSETEWAELNREFDEEGITEATVVEENPDEPWRKYGCYSCKDTGFCPHCEDDYEED